MKYYWIYFHIQGYPLFRPKENHTHNYNVYEKVIQVKISNTDIINEIEHNAP